MAFRQAVQITNSEVSTEYMKALAKYKQACKTYTNARLIACGENASVEAVYAHHLAKIKFKQECRIYTQAKDEFTIKMRELALKTRAYSHKEIENIIVETNLVAVMQDAKHAALGVSIPDKQKFCTAAVIRRDVNTSPEAAWEKAEEEYNKIHGLYSSQVGNNNNDTPGFILGDEDEAQAESEPAADTSKPLEFDKFDKI